MSIIHGTQEPNFRPGHLYKYRSFASDCDKQRLLHIIQANEIYCSSPASFNDPFDCKVPPVDSYDPAFVRYLIAARSAKTEEEHCEVYRKFVAPRMLKNTELKAFRSGLKAHEQKKFECILRNIQEKVNKSGVISFSINNDSILMWAHYASSHRGVCLIFSSEKWPDIRESLYPVTYRTTRLPLILNRQNFDAGQLFQAVILTKDQGWSYEQEWRVITPKSGPLKFCDQALVGVILGCNMADEDKARVRNAVGGRSHIALYEARVKESCFGLEILKY
ncbi:MAG: DUF2971 domain-containing protein [Proteobacteria bacterium]|nr:DUF2971 domain-containing protein [Pseudomonadota bacterium]